MPSQPGRPHRPSPISRLRISLSNQHKKIPYLRAIPYASLEIISLVALVNVLIWIAAAIVLRFYPHLSASSLLAYSLGLRHALDADHISAIDLTTRRLLVVERKASNQLESDKNKHGIAEHEQRKSRPVVTVGMWFSLGHSTIVILTTVLVAATTAGISSHFDAFSSIGGIIGSSVSTGFLLLLGAINAWLLWKGIQALKKVIKVERARLWSNTCGANSVVEDHIASTETYPQLEQGSTNLQVQETEDVDLISMIPYPSSERDITNSSTKSTALKSVPAVTVINPENLTSNAEPPRIAANTTTQIAVEESLTLDLPNRSCLSTLLRWALRLIDKPWKIYPLGVLFGLGFDTSSEIALLGITTLEASRSQSAANESDLGGGNIGTGPLSPAAIWAILIFPLLFTAGMCLLDTADGALMYALYSQTVPSSSSSKGSSSSTLLASSYANVILTGFTVFVALGVGMLQMLNMLSNVLPEWRIDENPEFWNGVAVVGDRYDVVGGTICGMFLVVAVCGWAGYKRWRKWVLARNRNGNEHTISEGETRANGGSRKVNIEDVV